MQRALWGSLLVLLSAGAAGCDDDKTKDEGPKAPPPPQQGGALGHATFKYKCLLVSDAQCDFDQELGTGIGGNNYTLPAIATGATFGLDYQITELPGVDAKAPAQIVGLHPDFATATPEATITAKKPGKTSLGLQRPDEMIDIIDVEIADMVNIKVFAGDPQGKFDDVGVTPSGVTFKGTFTFRFRVVPQGAGDKLLAGSFPCSWTTSDENIAKITTPPEDNIVTVVTGAAGTATITVKLGEKTLAIPITVGG